MMKSRLIALLTAAAVAASSLGATPAIARDRDEQRALALILGAVALGVILNNEEKRRDGARQRSYLPPPLPPRERRPEYRQHPHWRHWQRQTVIPAQCVYDIRSDSVRGPLVSKSCLADLGLARGLPDECAFRVRTHRGLREVYGPRCLEDFGYRIEDVRY